MSYEYFEHQADVGIIGRGKTLAEAFQEAAKAMFGVMYNIDKVQPVVSVSVECKAEVLDELFVEWLNALISEADLRRLVLADFKVEIRKRGNIYTLYGIAKGETYNDRKHGAKTEVKAATYSQLKVGPEDNKFIAKCVVDV